MPDETLISLLYCASLPESFIELVLNNLSQSVRQQVASNNNTPHTVLEKLSTDEDSLVRREVASNKNTLPTILKIIFLF